jgi:hypothetical protein
MHLSNISGWQDPKFSAARKLFSTFCGLGAQARHSGVNHRYHVNTLPFEKLGIVVLGRRGKNVPNEERTLWN